jgi:hypothetical protein
MFFPFNLVDFVVNGDTFRWGTLAMLLLGASVFILSLLKVVHHYFASFRAIFSLGQKKGLTIW